MGGILSVTRHGRRFFRPGSTPADEEWVYQLALPMQVSATQAGAFVNIRKGRMNLVDLEVGNDFVVFDDLDTIGAAPATAINRSDYRPHPTLGATLLMARYPVAAGFVPLGAKRADGSPHPHAGTGFGVSSVIGFPIRDGAVKRVGDFPERFECNELQEYTFDGATLRVTGSELVRFEDLCAGWRIVNRPIGSAIPDGDDLVYGMSGGRPGERVGAVFTRWRRVEGKWRIVECHPVTRQDGSFEPSLVRDADGSLVMSVRDPTGSIGANAGSSVEKTVRLFRSTDGGRTWSTLLHAEKARACTPVSIAKAADGTLYVAGNPDRELDTFGRKQRHSILMREELVAWPVSADRRSLGARVMLRDTNADFGPPPGGTIWNADHPIGLTVRLRDGRWRHVLCYRVLELGENQGTQGPTHATGCYVEEVVTEGEGAGDWRF